jgi:hypothetical protein
LELVGDFCQVEGQWFGVRGRRFMRPALTVVADGRPIRLLADLAEKPWAAEDGQPWRATFPYTIEGALSSEAELSVAPDVTVTVRAPERLASLEGLHRPERMPPTSTVGSEPGEVDAPMRELADLRDTQRRLQQRLDRMEAEKTETAQRLQELSGQLRAVTREREEFSAARDRIAAELEAVQRDRDAIVADHDRGLRERHRMTVDREATQRAHDAALRASEAAGVARDRALSERGSALAAQRQAASERAAAVAARDQAVAERDAALSLRDHALAERSAAVAARDEAVSAREALSRTSERLQAELADLHSGRGAALVMRRAAQAPAVSLRYARIIPGAIMIVVVLAVAFGLLVFLRVL